jgi:hypothetical protein
LSQPQIGEFQIWKEWKFARDPGDGQKPEFDGMTDAADDAELRVRVLLHHVSRPHLLVRKHPFPEVAVSEDGARGGSGWHVVDGLRRHAGVVEQLHPVLRMLLQEDGLQHLLQLNPVRNALRIGDEARVVREVRQPEGAAERHELQRFWVSEQKTRALHNHLLVIACSHDKLAVTCLKSLVRHYAGVRVAQPLRLLARSQPVGRDVCESEHLGLQQWGLDVLPATVATAAAPELKRGAPASRCWGQGRGQMRAGYAHSTRTQHASHDVCDCNADLLRRAVGSSGDVHEATYGLRHEVVTLIDDSVSRDETGGGGGGGREDYWAGFTGCWARGPLLP